MQTQKKTMWSVLAVSAILMLLAIAVIIRGKMSAAQRDGSQPAAEAGTSVSVNFSEVQPIGATKYFCIHCRTEDTESVKFLKVVKASEGTLFVYEAASLEAAQDANTATVNLTGTWEISQDGETWTISCDNGFYTKIISISQAPKTLQSWDVVLPEGATNYYMISCKTYDEIVTKYVKAVKSSEGLTLYEGDTLDAAKGSTSATTGFTGVYDVSNDEEIWYIGGGDEEGYRDIMTVSPINTTISANKVWNARDENGYVDVADGTAVRFALYVSGTTDPVQVFCVKKTVGTDGTKLLISKDGIDYTDSSLVIDGKTINAKLKAADGSMWPEEWFITITGYERTNDQGGLIEYTVKEQGILSSSQPWISNNPTTMAHTFDGNEVRQNGEVVYTLVLRGNVQGEEDAAGASMDFEVLRITKHVQEGKVIELKVQGLQGPIYSSSGTDSVVFATVYQAEFAVDGNTKIMMAATDGIIYFNDNASIRLSDIQGSARGVDVSFLIGVDNARANVQLQLTESGKLSYRFTGLPADVFSTDPAGEINVDSYRVVTTFVN